VVDQLSDIPLAGRRFASPTADAATGCAEIALPAFATGPENRLVAATFRRLLDWANTATVAYLGERPTPPSVFVLYGSSGTGKTHLAHGLVRHWQERQGSEAAEYLTANDFRRRYAAAIREESVLEFRRLIRSRQLLAIDDLDHLPSDDYVLQELRYTIDAYVENGGTLLATLQRPASALAAIPADVRNRLAAGISLQLAPPGSASRLRIVQQASAALGRSISADAAQRLADGVAGTTTDLMGALFELFSAPYANGSSDAKRVERILAARKPTLQEIISVAARYTRVPKKQLKSGSRRQSVVRTRAMVVYLGRELAGASYHEIGRALGGRDHTTIMHNYRKIDEERLLYPATQESLDELRRILMSH
jgi:chromosomal replication initiator protein